MREEPIDFVLIWVDGSDPAWVGEKNAWLARETCTPADIDAGEIRYRDWDNLRYWFRGVETYAPWVRRVHFVTCGQIPPWLNPEAPKLHLVRHRDYIPAEYLPTFSSHPIELNLHRIPGLSQQFVYFNDDMFLTAPVKAGDFFRKGLPRDCICEDPFQYPVAEIFNNILINNMVALNRHYDRLSLQRKLWRKWYPLCAPHDTFKNLVMTLVRKPYFFGLDAYHLPQPFRKESFQAVWEMEPELLSQTCAHRFRNEEDVNQYLIKFYQLLEGRFQPRNMRKLGIALQAERNLARITDIIRTQKFPTLCINDGELTDFPHCRDEIRRAFQDALPDKSSFEK